jgi:hypothetical protein
MCKQSSGSLSTGSQASLCSIKLCSACELANNLRLKDEEEYYLSPLFKEKIVPKRGHFNFALTEIFPEFRFFIYEGYKQVLLNIYKKFQCLFAIFNGGLLSHVFTHCLRQPPLNIIENST